MPHPSKAKTKRHQNNSGNKNKILDAALRLAATEAWAGVSLTQIARVAKVPTNEVARLFPETSDIVVALMQRTDEQVRRAGSDANESPRERLFDVTMRRFDLLQAHRAAVLSVLDAVRRDRGMACKTARHMRSLVTTLLETAQIPVHGLSGEVKRAGLSVVYLYVVSVWRRDDSADMARTMAALDRNLSRAEFFAEMLPS